MHIREGADSRCCTPRAEPLIDLDWVDHQNPEVVKLIDWLQDLPDFEQQHELGEIEALFAAALLGNLKYTSEPNNPVEAISADPEMFELRHRGNNKTLLRFYHAEPHDHPDTFLRLHQHIKINGPHQQVQIEFAKERYRREGTK